MLTLKEFNPVSVITWENDDGTVLETDIVPRWSIPAYQWSAPTKQSTAQYEYTFDAWSPQIWEVWDTTKTYTATYTQTVRSYTITWENRDWTVLDTDTVAYWSTPSYSWTPTRPSDSDYDYTFAWWDNQVVPVTEDATYVATYTATPIAVLPTIVCTSWTTIYQSGTLEFTITNVPDDDINRIWRDFTEQGTVLDVNSVNIADNQDWSFTFTASAYDVWTDEVSFLDDDTAESRGSFEISVEPDPEPFAPLNSILLIEQQPSRWGAGLLNIDLPEPGEGTGEDEYSSNPVTVAFFATDGVNDENYVEATLSNGELTITNYYWTADNELCHEMFEDEGILASLWSALSVLSWEYYQFDFTIRTDIVSYYNWEIGIHDLFLAFEDHFWWFDDRFMITDVSPESISIGGAWMNMVTVSFLPINSWLDPTQMVQAAIDDTTIATISSIDDNYDGSVNINVIGVSDWDTDMTVSDWFTPWPVSISVELTSSRWCCETCSGTWTDPMDTSVPCPDCNWYWYYYSDTEAPQLYIDADESIITGNRSWQQFTLDSWLDYNPDWTSSNPSPIIDWDSGWWQAPTNSSGNTTAHIIPVAWIRWYNVMNNTVTEWTPETWETMWDEAMSITLELYWAWEYNRNLPYFDDEQQERTTDSDSGSINGHLRLEVYWEQEVFGPEGSHWANVNWSAELSANWTNYITISCPGWTITYNEPMPPEPEMCPDCAWSWMIPNPDYDPEDPDSEPEITCPTCGWSWMIEPDDPEI